jgi:hypothetical protein
VSVLRKSCEYAVLKYDCVLFAVRIIKTHFDQLQTFDLPPKERRIIRSRTHQLKFAALLALRRSGEALKKAETFAEKKKIVEKK